MTSPRLYWDCTDGHPFPSIYDEVTPNVLLAGFSVGQSRHFEARRSQQSRDVGVQVLKDAWQSEHVFPVQHIGNCFRIIRERLGSIATSALSRRGMRETFAGPSVSLTPEGSHQFSEHLKFFGFQSVNHETGHRADLENIGRHVDIAVEDASELIGRERFAAHGIAIARASAWAGPAGACFIIDPENALQINPRDYPPLQLDSLLFSLAVVSWEVNAPEIEKRFEANQEILDAIITGLSTFSEISIHTPLQKQNRAGHLVSFSIAQCDGEFAAMLYDEQGISVGSQSACLAQAGQPSEVLKALNIDTAGHIRVSLPLESSLNDVERFLIATQTVLQKINSEREFLAE